MSSMDPMRDDSWILSETMRRTFASTVSLSSDSKHKVIIIDEADNTSNDVQLLLRAFIEEFAGNCRFIFTCNYKNKILEPLHSRCAVVEFGIKGKERQTIAGHSSSNASNKSWMERC